MNDNPKVSIIINNYNYGRFLQEAIDSALSQTYLNREVIVVDDGSTDNSREIISNYGHKIIPIFKENAGQASTFNAGFAASQGDIICLLDSDDIFLPEKVASVVDVLRSDHELGWCFHIVKKVDIISQTVIKSWDEVPSYKCDMRLLLKTGKENGKFPELPPTSGLSFTRSLLQNILPMPEAQNISLSDNYLKYTALGLKPGFALMKELSLQRIHADNAFTLRNNKQKIIARIETLTAYWMRAKFPFLSKFSNKLFASGLSLYWQVGGVDTESQELVNEYLSSVTLLEKLEIKARAFYYRVKQ